MSLEEEKRCKEELMVSFKCSLKTELISIREGLKK